VVGAQEGLSVLVLEKTEWLGGTTAYSAGTCWIPGHRHQRDPAADTAAARRYLDSLVGDRAPRELRETYLTHGPAAIDYLDRIGVGFWHSPTVVDYHPEIDGSAVGRALEPQTFDGRTLGRARFGRIRRPVPGFALFHGTLMVRRPEVNQLLSIFDGSVRGMAVSARYPARHGQRARREPLPPAPEHKGFLKSQLDAGRLRVSGPLGPDGTPGALLVFEAGSPDDVTALLNQDPFHREGLIAERTVREWQICFGGVK
jgi:uncharacterized protein YciI